jgi:hypothetical protein
MLFFIFSIIVVLVYFIKNVCVPYENRKIITAGRNDEVIICRELYVCYKTAVTDKGLFLGSFYSRTSVDI